MTPMAIAGAAIATTPMSTRIEMVFTASPDPTSGEIARSSKNHSPNKRVFAAAQTSTISDPLEISRFRISYFAAAGRTVLPSFLDPFYPLW